MEKEEFEGLIGYGVEHEEFVNIINVVRHNFTRWHTDEEFVEWFKQFGKEGCCEMMNIVVQRRMAFERMTDAVKEMDRIRMLYGCTAC